MANSHRFAAFGTVLFLFITYGIPISFYLLSSPDTAAEIAAALRSRGGYSASIADLGPKLEAAEKTCPKAEITVFVFSNDTEYGLCVSEKPEVQVVLSRVGREDFGPEGRLSNGSVLQRCGGAGNPIQVTESYWLTAKVADWNLYDDGRVVVHGIRGSLGPGDPVRAVGRLGISGLVGRRREEEKDALCWLSPMDVLFPPRDRGFRAAYSRPPYFERG